MSEPEMHMVMGLPSAGKTTYAEESWNIPENASVIELEMYASDTAAGPRMQDSDWGRVFRDMVESAKVGESIVIDGNNTHTTSRRSIIDMASQAGYKTRTLHVLCTPPKKCLKRMKVGSDGYAQARKILSHQTDMFMTSLVDIQEEWWDKVVFVGQGQGDKEAPDNE